MEITNEQLSKLRKKLGDEVLTEIGIKLTAKVDRDKIYAFFTGTTVYKLHENLSNSRAFWINMSNSRVYFDTHEDSLQSAYDSVIGRYKIEEFTSVQDFSRWILTKM